MVPGIEEALASGVRLAPLDVEQYHRMIESGILPEGAPIELLDGALVYKDRSAVGGEPMTVGPSHALVVMRLQRIAPRLDPLGCHMRSQTPITLPPRHEPEPDGVIAQGTVGDYADRHPGPADVLAVFEAAESSRSIDRTVKLRIYADAGIRQYVLIDIPGRQVELYTEPVIGEGRYARKTVLTPVQTLRLHLGADRTLEIAVAEVLP